MVADEENRASRSQQGLKMKIKMFLIPQQPKTYSQIFTIAREVEQELEKKNQDKMQMKLVKRPSQFTEGEDSDMPLDTPLVKQPLQPRPQHMICEYCLNLGHLQRNRQKAYELCFVCGSGGHLKSDCPFKKAENTSPIRSTHPVPPLGEDPGPIGRGTSLHPQQQLYSQAQRRPRVRTDDRRRQTYNLTEEVKILNGVRIGRDA